MLHRKGITHIRQKETKQRLLKCSPFTLFKKKCILLQDTGEPGWWRGEIGGKEGVFPDNFVTIMSEAEKEVRPEKEYNKLLAVISISG